jgi:hypothetical protein
MSTGASGARVPKLFAWVGGFEDEEVVPVKVNSAYRVLDIEGCERYRQVWAQCGGCGLYGLSRGQVKRFPPEDRRCKDCRRREYENLARLAEIRKKEEEKAAQELQQGRQKQREKMYRKSKGKPIMVGGEIWRGRF